MTLGSPALLLFALGTLVACAVSGRRRRWLALLVASGAFYVATSSAWMLAVLAGVAVVSWGAALGIERHAGTGRARWFFRAGVLGPLGALLGLKYVGFVAGSVDAVAGWLGRPAAIGAVPVFAALGVSYYVLQAISYLIDVRDGVIPAERHLGLHALALAFFPKVIQGPIERAENLLPQLRDPRPLALQDVAAGARLFVWGLFQKQVVADRLAPFVDAVYSDVHRHPGLPLLVATYLYAAQLYFDFAGYTDMALGLGRALGVRLTPNFASPYLARSVAEFWRRWHISLSSWLLDYLFKPLQLGLRHWRTWSTPVALLVTFLASGLWHGASWSFVAWGLLHGTYLATSVLYRPLQRRVHAALRLSGSRLLAAWQVAVTFHLVCLGWVFFRAPTPGDAVAAVRSLVAGLPGTVAQAFRGGDLDALLYLGQGRGAFLAALAAVVVGGVLRSLLGRTGALVSAPDAEAAPVGLPVAYARTAMYAVLVYGIAILGTSAQSFLYARF